MKASHVDRSNLSPLTWVEALPTAPKRHPPFRGWIDRITGAIMPWKSVLPSKITIGIRVGKKVGVL